MDLASAPVAFWLTTAAMTACALAFVLPALLRRRAPSPGPSQPSVNLELHREALAEIDRDVTHGVLPAAERTAARTELLDRAEEDIGDAPGEPLREARAPWVALVLAGLFPVLVFTLYGVFGDPGAMAGDLSRHLEARPADGRGWVILARQELERGRFAEAGAAFERAVAVSRRVAEDPAVWCEYADAVGMAQDRRLAGRPAALIARAQALDGSHPCVLEMSGSVAFERGDFAAAARQWRQLLPRLADDPSRRQLAAAIRAAERR